MEIGPAELDERSILAAARDALRDEIEAGCRLLVTAAQWADLHPSESVLTPAERLEWFGEKAILYGGVGTPDVAETAAGTLAVEIGLNVDQARNLISDALDARHRMPQIWQLIEAGQVRRDTVHRIAYRTRHLSCEQVEDISRQIAGSLPRLVPGQRLDNLVDAQIKRVDRERLERIAAEAIHDRYVCKGRPDDEGMTDLFIHTTVADAEASMVAITRFAKILFARKDNLPPRVPVRDARTTDGGANGRDGTDCLDEWRAVAAQLLQTNPGLALQIQLEADHPNLFDAAAETISQLDSEPHDPKVIAEIVRELIKHIDFTKLQPSAVLHLHIAEGSLDSPFGPADPRARLARVEGLGAVYLDVVRQWLGQACTVKLQPVMDTGDIPAIDRYEFSPAMPEAMLAQSPASRFPWSTSLNRRNDLDHTTPYLPPDRGGPPGQTGIHNGAPLTRREHRYKTFGSTSVRQPQPDTHVWKTKHGRVLIVNPAGTFDLGTGDFARAVWAATVRMTDEPSAGELFVRTHLALTA